MDFKIYKSRLIEYLSMKGYSEFNMNIACPFHEDKNPSMRVHPDGAQCFSQCGQKDIYDFIGLFEGIPEKKDQFLFAEKLFHDYAPIHIEKKPKFTPDEKSTEIVLDFMRKSAEKNKKYLLNFVNHRGYFGIDAEKFIKYLGYWPGCKKIIQPENIEICKKAGIPFPTEEKQNSSWDHEGVVIRLNKGFELMYVYEGKTIKRCSYGSENFPYPGLPKGNKGVLVEGAMDAIPCLINNIPAVSIGGTCKFKPEHAEQLKIYDEIIICMNNDEAGKKAVIKISEMLMQVGFIGKIEIILFPVKIDGINKKIDCDELIKNGKIEILKKYLG